MWTFIFAAFDGHSELTWNSMQSHEPARGFFKRNLLIFEFNPLHYAITIGNAFRSALSLPTEKPLSFTILSKISMRVKLGSSSRQAVGSNLRKVKRLIEKSLSPFPCDHECNSVRIGKRTSSNFGLTNFFQWFYVGASKTFHWLLSCKIYEYLSTKRKASMTWWECNHTQWK